MAAASTSYMTLNNCDFETNFNSAWQTKFDLSPTLSQINEPGNTTRNDPTGSKTGNKTGNKIEWN
jgi:hypothetical protein